MRLFEEYFKRHNITNVPLVHHDCYGAVIFESKETNKKMIIFISWVDYDVRPGKYIINYSYPVHNGFLENRFFEHHSRTEKTWDQYEPYFIDLASKLKNVRALENEKEILLTTWEMFLLIYDDWFLTLPSNIKEILFESINKENTINFRYDKYQELYFYIGNNYPSILDNWRKLMLIPIIEPYSFWLAKLINENNQILLEG